MQGTTSWYVFDGLGSVLEEVNPSGTVTASRRYDVYGGQRATYGTATSSHQFVGALGHDTDAATGYIYMNARYMDPATGAFVSEDPGRNGSNWFQYCGANPASELDADGRKGSLLDQVLAMVNDEDAFWAANALGLEALGFGYCFGLIQVPAFAAAAVTCGIGSAYAFAVAFGAPPGVAAFQTVATEFGSLIFCLMAADAGLVDEVGALSGAVGIVAVTAYAMYGLMVMGALAADDIGIDQ